MWREALLWLGGESSQQHFSSRNRMTRIQEQTCPTCSLSGPQHWTGTQNWFPTRSLTRPTGEESTRRAMSSLPIWLFASNISFPMIPWWATSLGERTGSRGQKSIRINRKCPSDDSCLEEATPIGTTVYDLHSNKSTSRLKVSLHQMLIRSTRLRSSSTISTRPPLTWKLNKILDHKHRPYIHFLSSSRSSSHLGLPLIMLIGEERNPREDL